ncbi:small ribosomal subunit protein mS39 [Brachionichthys hirsutus]|uniref:small ribosomal subunit protein mS39 n=1 Tax=Brachionichthys hirsutus TaxID=412623 RepID=UPI00360538A8
MAALRLRVGHSAQRNCRFWVNNFEHLWINRRFGWTPAPRQQIEEAYKETSETIVVPRRKTWSKEAVLEALASTVSRDLTAFPHRFQDDPYLSPQTFAESMTYTLTHQSGTSAAKYFISCNPKLFTKDFAEPHIPCLMPEAVPLHLEEVTEEALKERISLRKVSAAVDLHDQLLQVGTAVSMETTHDLLDLICLHCDRDPDREGEPELEDFVEESDKKVKKKKWNVLLSKRTNSTWKENNNAERIFHLLPERDARCYSALIRGMVMHGAYAKAFSCYADMLNARLAPDLHIFNALLSAAFHLRQNSMERRDFLLELLTQMSKQEVQPNLQTFNSVLGSLRHCGVYGKPTSLETLNEMKALGIAPSLTSYYYILQIFNKREHVHESNRFVTVLLQEMMSLLEGQRLTCQGPDDVYFFMTAVKICVAYKDMELAYKVQSVVEFGENWRLLGNPYQQKVFYGNFFSLLCMLEPVDAVLAWYRRHYPSLYYPSHVELGNLLQALDTDSRLDLLPAIWNDIRCLRYDTNASLMEELLSLMSRDRHSPEVQRSFGECALEVQRAFEENKERLGLVLSSTALSNVTALLLRADKTQQAWDMLPLFKSRNRVPREDLMEECLTVCRGGGGSAERAVELVQLSAAFSLSATSRLAKFTLAQFQLTEEQRAVLSDLESAGLAETPVNVHRRT